MSELFAAVPYLVAIAFFLAAALKVRDLTLFSEELEDYGMVPPRLLPVVRIAIPVAEIAAAALVFTSAFHAAGAAALILLLLIFIAATVIRLRSGDPEIRCACFGRSSQRLSWTVPGRNAVLALALVPAALGADQTLTMAGLVAATLAAFLVWLSIEHIKLITAAPEVRNV